MIKEGMGAYWKCTKTFGIVTKVAVTTAPRYKPHIYFVWWEDFENSHDSVGYGIGDITADEELVIGDYKALRLLYGSN